MELKQSELLDCPLCSSAFSANNSIIAARRKFYHCNNCDLIFADKAFIPSPEKEKQRYDHHQNSMDDTAYLQFLNQALSPALDFLNPSHIGLDYGCGKNTVLSHLLAKHDIKCDNYDIFYFPVLENKMYDFVFCTETAEHFSLPKIDFENIVAHLKKGGFFILMTEFWNNELDFSNWYYVRDFTHLSFYHLNTIKYIAQKFNLSIVFNDAKRVVIFIKN
jgi:hypothetical protein